jgi:hypothetical protein
MGTRRRRALSSDARGAVFVEFLIAFLPMFVLFSCLVQLGFLQAADLVTKHSAWMGARAAIVIISDDPAYYGEAGGLSHNDNSGLLLANDEMQAEIGGAVSAILQSIDANPNVAVTLPSAPGGNDNRTQYGIEDMVHVQVHYTYPCLVPIGSLFVCGFGRTAILTGESVMPMQGANFKYPGWS